MANDHLYQILKSCIPDDHARQVGSTYYVEQSMQKGRSGRRVMDLGCGRGRTYDLFRKYDRKVEWHGVDIESSPEVNARTRTDGTFHTFDGVHLPFEDSTFDVIYSHQVFEHVRHPDALLRDVARVLRPGGRFIGSVSYLEPYHSFSIFNFTPYGWHTVVTDAGMKVIELRPGIDGVALIQRQYHGRPEEASNWFVSSPMNEEIDAWGEETARRPRLINLRKLMFCGHLVFHAEKP